MKYKIIADSSCDIDYNYLKSTNIDFSIAPLSIIVNDKEFIDNENLNVKEMLSCMKSYNGKSTSSCPSPDAFLQNMNGADKYFVVTISSKLSGSYNSANIARDLTPNPENIFVIDSKSTSGNLLLIINKLVKLINKELSFEQICEEITNYTNHNLGLLFVLDKFDNLVKNGRISPLKAKIGTTLSIKPVCEADDGEIKINKNVLGIKQAIKQLISEIGKKITEPLSKTVVISHCFNKEVAEEIKKELIAKFKIKDIVLLQMRGLCSFYALEKGIIVSYEN